ncbi:MAG: aspartate carbamoyltransferase [Armatimonadota bacterium]
MAKRDLISPDDLSPHELSALLDLAAEMERGGAGDLCAGKILATLFYEPSTRTRLSFESAMLRLGGRTLGFADPGTSSAKKGETIADTARMIQAYADIIVMRHYLEGAARAAADYALAPVINAGDGGHMHPTQTLTDLYTLKKAKGAFEGLVVGLCGDLKYGRTVHSLAPVLARLGAKVYCIAPAELAMPEECLREARAADAVLGETADLDAVIGELDALYATRVQKERFASSEEYERVKGTYVVTAALLCGAKPDMVVLHPLPRVDEIAYEVDEDPRAAYFEQAANGVPVRMALIAALLGLSGEVLAAEPRTPGRARPRAAPETCANASCVTNHEHYLTPQFAPVPDEPRLVHCIYCDHEVQA